VRNSLKLLHTSTFRLAALYLFVFAISVGALLAYIYYNTAGLLERQTDETIQAEVQALADQYFQRGLGGVLQTVRNRSASETGAVYLLISEDGERIAGNLDAMPATAGKLQKAAGENWIEFPFVVKGQNGNEVHQARAYHAELAAGYNLIVGRDVQELRQFRGIIQRTLVWSLLIALILGLGGGLLMSRNFLHRIDAITGASRSIMAGDLSGRMPVSGTGDELDRLAVSLNEMLSQIERLMAGMREVSSNVAHDLRTPLTRMKARVESALRSGTPLEQKAALEKTIEESDRLLQTFNSLLSIARAEAGQSAESLQLTDARPIIEDVAELYEPMAEEQGGSLKTEVTDKLPVRADRQLLAQAINNLVDNALKYGAVNGQGPDIVVSGAREDGKIVITVADRGQGIAEKDRPRVVERFVRLEESRTKPGSGLGLSLVQGVMKLHGGEFVLEDNAPGLKAKLILPRQEAAV
jgi:signal transduction histidine kinase